MSEIHRTLPKVNPLELVVCKIDRLKKLSLWDWFCEREGYHERAWFIITTLAGVLAIFFVIPTLWTHYNCSNFQSECGGFVVISSFMVGIPFLMAFAVVYLICCLFCLPIGYGYIDYSVSKRFKALDENELSNQKKLALEELEKEFRIEREKAVEKLQAKVAVLKAKTV